MIKKYTWKRVAVCMLSSFFVISSAYSQELPSAGEELRRQQQQERFDTLPTRIPETEKLIEEEKKKPKSDSVVFIKDVVFTGKVTVFKKYELYNFVSKLIAKKTTLSEWFLVIDQITQHYRNKGFILARALLPPQDITDGIITIDIQEGLLDKGQDGVKINGQDIRLNTDFATKLFTCAVESGSVIHNEKLERGVLLLNDLPGINASVNLEPGSVTGTTRVVLDVNETSLIKPRVTWNNSGSRLTGAYKGGFTIDVNDLTGYGDQLSTTYQGSLDGGSFHYLRTAGNIPIGYSGFKLGASFQYLVYEAGKEFESLDSKGDAFQWGVDGEYPIIRRRKTNLWVKAGFVQKILQDEALGVSTNHKLLNIGSLGLTATYADNFLRGGFTQGNITGYYGNNDLSGLNSSYQSDQSAVGAKTDGNFAKGLFNVRRIQRVAEDLILISNISGQLASKNLSSSEKF